MKRFLICAMALLITGLPQSAQALLFNKLLVIPDGVTAFVPPGWKVPIYVIKSWRDNPNAHAFFNISFLMGDMQAKKLTNYGRSVDWADDDDRYRLNVIGVHDAMGVSEVDVSTRYSTGTTVRDYKILFKKHDMFLVEAERPQEFVGQEINHMHVTIYKLTANDTDPPDMDTQYFFKRIIGFNAPKNFVHADDADEALDAERNRIIDMAR